METKYKSVLEQSFECPVCLDTVKTPFKVCTRGHVACRECITTLENCPLCRGLYVLENPVCIQSLLDALPRPCVYSIGGCKEIVEPGNDHQMFCGYRPLVCIHHNCSVKMPLVNFLDHHENHHSDLYLCKKENDNISWKINPDSSMRSYSPVSLFNNIFWIYEVNDVKEKLFKIYFEVIPIGKLEHNYYVRVTLGKDKFVYTHTIKATVLNSCDSKHPIEEKDDKYCMRIPQSELHRFINEDGELKYTYNFFRESLLLPSKV